jgi:subtilisin family serine protease
MENLMKKINLLLKLCIYTMFSIIVLFTVVTVADNDHKLHRTSLKDYADDEILVKFKEDASDFSMMTTIQTQGDSKIKKVSNKKIIQVKLKEGQTVEDAIAEYYSYPNVEYAQPNFIYHIMATAPLDPDYEHLWGLKNTGQIVPDASYPTNNPGKIGDDMDLELAWDIVTDCSSVIVAVVDSGINYNHEDLAANMWSSINYPNHGYDFVDDDDDPMDYNGHGTHCAGTIGAVGNNNIGTTGVCWKVQLMAVRVLNTAGAGYTSDIISGIYFAVSEGAKILSMSIGSYYFDQAYYDALKDAQTNGVLVIAAAGNDDSDNDGGTHTYPCDYDLDNIIGVAALDQSYELAHFSNYGSTSVDVGAPGTNILSEWHGIEDTISDDFTVGWTESGTGGWARGVREIDGIDYNMLFNPDNWGEPDWGNYSNNADDRIWKTFDISGYDVSALNFDYWFDLEENYDYFDIYCNNGASDPVEGGTLLDWGTGSTDGYFYSYSGVIPESYRTSECSIGFRLDSDNIYTYNGVSIMEFSISRITLTDNSYNTINGTSMATPHVAGLAALIWTINPGYDYMDVAESIKYGGESIPSLAGITTRGKAVNAWGSARYVTRPTGVTVTKG